MKVISRLALVLAFVAPLSRAQVLTYSFTGRSTSPTTSQANLTGSVFSGNVGSPAAGDSTPTFTAGSGGGYFGADTWTGTAPGTNYFQFTITPAEGFAVTLTSLSFGYRATSTGPNAISFRSGSDSYSTNLVSSALTRDSSWHTSGSLTLTSTTITSATTFRIYGSGASSAGGTFRVDDVTLNGSISAIPEPSTYAAIVGAASLAGAIWWRRRQSGPPPPSSS